MRMCTYFGTLTLIIMIILWTSICLQDAQAIRNRFEVVQRCPFNESEWKVRAAHTTCNGSESYHCLITEGGVSLREQCTDASLFTSGFCPIFTNEGYLQWSACKDTACPTSSYRSDEVYQYQICYKKIDNPKEKNTEKGSNDSSFVTGMTIIIVAILVTFVLISVLVFYKWNLYGFKNKVQQCFFEVAEDETPEAHPLVQQAMHNEIRLTTYKLNGLLKYLVYILKQELGVNDLKEKVVIHSKSINEHFSEPLRKDLQNVKNLNDYSKLDMSLVFALLRNFCEGIMPPSRGWDYEPPDDETPVGADIERIRLMWNMYCDNDIQFKHLDDVYNRMKQKFGNLPVHGGEGSSKNNDEDDFELMKDKIQSIKLNPDCTVKKGIVITENITTALKILSSRNVVILKGVIGCGKTHALKAMQYHFEDKNLETAWVEPENIIRKISESKEKPTILLCDNLFGRFGSSVFSQSAVDQIEEVLKKIERSEQTTKVAIGIHTHVFDEVKKTLKLNFLHQKNITVEMDYLAEAEALLIFKEQLAKGHCKMNSNCWFKTVGFQSVMDKISKNQGHIGGPFLSLMYCNQHELYSDEAFPVNPIQTLVQYFLRMRQDSPISFDCFVYLMCVQQHNIEEEPENWAGLISVEITKNNIMNLALTSGLLQVDDTIATLAHELLTTALFKYVAAVIHNDLPVLQKCDSDVFLQILRPSDSFPCDLYAECMCDKSDYKSIYFRKMCAYRLAEIYQKKGIAHPLMKIQLVRNKYYEIINTMNQKIFPY